MLAITVYSRPRYPPIFRALAGDSTTTKPLFFFTATKSFLLARRGLLPTGVGLVSGLSTAKMRGDCLSEGCARLRGAQALLTMPLWQSVVAGGRLVKRARLGNG